MFRRIFIVLIIGFNFLNSFAQTDSMKISNSEIRTACLIFTEHEYLSIENPLLKQQIKSLEELNQLYINTDSIQKEEIYIYKEKVASDEKKIQHLKSIQKKSILGFSVGGIVLFIIGLIL